MNNSVPDAQNLYEDLKRGVANLLAGQNAHLVGVASGGEHLAKRLQVDLQLTLPIGVISSSMHRDDFLERGFQRQSSATHLPFEVNDAHIVLIDDVLYTGRTVRAVINELFDYGRVASIRLAVLLKREGSELPIAPDFFAHKVSLPKESHMRLESTNSGKFTWRYTE